MTTPFGLWFGDTHIGFGTHAPALAAAVFASSKRPILEYGLGFYSTPLLHMLAEELDRGLLSLENDLAWAEKFKGLETPKHYIAGVTSWEASESIVDAFTDKWSVVLIDHGPDERRIVDAARLAQKAEFVVVHDWGEIRRAAYAPHFKFLWEGAGSATAVLSNERMFPGLDFTSR